MQKCQPKHSLGTGERCSACQKRSTSLGLQLGLYQCLLASRLLGLYSHLPAIHFKAHRRLLVLLTSFLTISPHAAHRPPSPQLLTTHMMFPCPALLDLAMVNLHIFPSALDLSRIALAVFPLLPTKALPSNCEAAISVVSLLCSHLLKGN